MTKRGKIIPNGVALEVHEFSTILYFTELGKTIELIPASHTPGAKTPDFKMNGVLWEMKCPQGKSKTTLEHAFKKAITQSDSVIFDLRHIKFAEDLAINTLTQLFKQTRRCKRLIIITKSQNHLDFKK